MTCQRITAVVFLPFLAVIDMIMVVVMIWGEWGLGGVLTSMEYLLKVKYSSITKQIYIIAHAISGEVTP